jgi:hypothetical protein
MISQIKYKNIMDPVQLSLFNVNDIKAYKPILRESDYTKGYIVRYFVQRVNDSNSIVYEIAKDDYLTYVINAFYITTNLDWKIGGTMDDIKVSNEKSIRLAAKKLPAIQMFLVNYLEFSKQ